MKELMLLDRIAMRFLQYICPFLALFLAFTAANGENKMLTLDNSNPGTLTHQLASGLPPNPNNACGDVLYNFNLTGHTGTVLEWSKRHQDGSGSWTSWTVFETTDDITNLDHLLLGWASGIRTYEVRATVQDGSNPAVYATTTVIVNSKPAIYNITGGGTYCDGTGGMPIGLSSSETGVNYQLKLNGTNVGSPIAGTGSALYFGNQTVGGTYTIEASRPSTITCTETMNGSQDITVLTTNSYNVTGGGTFCAGGSGFSVGLDGSQTGIRYYLKRDGNLVAEQDGTGSAIDWGIHTTSGTYIVEAGRATSPFCPVQMTGNAIITQVPIPSELAITGGGSYCTGGSGVSVGLSHTELNVAYRMTRDGSNVGPFGISGTGAAMDFGLQTTAGTYSFTATSTVDASCATTFASSVDVTIDPVTVAGTLTGATSTTAPATGTIQLNGKVGTVTKYQYFDTGGWYDIVTSNDPYQYVNVIEPTRFRAYVQSGACPYQISNEVLIDVEHSLTLTATPAIARPNKPVTLTTKSGYPSYTWFKNGTVIFTGSSNTHVVNEAGLYKVQVTINGTDHLSPELLIRADLGENNSVTVYKFKFPHVSVSPLVTSFDKSRVNVSTDFYDGLGRVNQKVLLEGAPTGHDIVVPIDYDVLGRQEKEYLSYVDTDNSSIFKGNALDETDYTTSSHYAYYMGSSHASANGYSQKVFDKSPLNRVTEQGSPGASWATGSGHSMIFAYDINDNGVVIEWDFDNLDSQASIKYAAGELYKTTTQDEDQNPTIEYKNKKDQTILKKSRVAIGQWAETYYIYDIHNQLRVVIPPEGTARLGSHFFGKTPAERTEFLKAWAFTYHYDHRNRMISKKVPGAEKMLMVYDDRNRLVLSQDGNQRLNDQWIFTKYDSLNRPIATGITVALNASHSTMQSTVSNWTTKCEAFDATNTAHGQYTTNAYPAANAIAEYLSFTYYDNYDFVPALGLTNSQFSWPTNLTADTDFHLVPHGHEATVQGQVTGSLTKVLGQSNYLATITYYDDKYRAIQVISQNHLGGTDVISNQYDFVGGVRRIQSVHDNGSEQHTTLLEYDYDHADRMTNAYHTFNQGTRIQLFTNEYNDLGELIKKTLHNNTNYAHAIEYEYNIRGWLRSINKSNLSGGTPQPSDLFGMELIYDTELPGLTNN